MNPFPVTSIADQQKIEAADVLDQIAVEVIEVAGIFDEALDVAESRRAA